MDSEDENKWKAFQAAIASGEGVFTIVETSEGTGSAAGWGLLKAYQSGRDGWISLEHAVRV